MPNICIKCPKIAKHSVETEDSRYSLHCDPDYYCTECYKDYKQALKNESLNPDNWNTCVYCGTTNASVVEEQDPEEGQSGEYRYTCNKCHDDAVEKFCR